MKYIGIALYSAVTITFLILYLMPVDVECEKAIQYLEQKGTRYDR
jgi:hypothetical protein